MKFKQTVLCFILSVCMLTFFMPAAAAEDETPKGIWTDYAAGSFAGGMGTEADPYQIASPEQLALLAADVNSGVSSKNHTGEYFVLIKDIDLSDHIWTPIGYESYGNGSAQSFSGHFDGKGHKVTGLYVDERGKNRSAGLFGCVVACDNKTIIQNLIVENGTVYAGDDTDDYILQYGAGLLIGRITIIGGSNVTGASVKNCRVSGMVSSNMYAGGLVGYANYTDFSDCKADAKVEGYCVAGGFAGYAFEAGMTDCSSTGNVKSKGWSTGGFAGILFNNTTVDHCAAFGNVEANDWNIGGFVGYAETGIIIKNSIAVGNVKSNVTDWQPKAGGFAGTVTDKTSLDKCHSLGKITAKDNETDGGMIGYAGDSKAKNCSFDSEKNTTLSAVGLVVSGLYEIAESNTNEVLANICTDYYGGHDLENVPQTDPTCTEVGYEAGSRCKNCGYKEGFAVIAALDHDFGNWKSNNDGTHTRTCSRDARHTETEACADTDKNHKCNLCGETLTDHTGGTATCTAKATCEICGEEYGETNAKNHTDLKHFDAKEATKASEGNIEYWHCDGCGKYFSDKAATNEITEKDILTEKLTVENKELTSPKTGENSNLPLWIAIMFIGSALIGIAVYKSKKEIAKEQ